MTQNMQRLKAEIITALDMLPVESLKLLAEFVTFLRAKAGATSTTTAGVDPQAPEQLNDPILQLGTHPVVEDVTDASIHHDTYLYSQ